MKKFFLGLLVAMAMACSAYADGVVPQDASVAVEMPSVDVVSGIVGGLATAVFGGAKAVTVAVVSVLAELPKAGFSQIGVQEPAPVEDKAIVQ